MPLGAAAHGPTSCSGMSQMLEHLQYQTGRSTDIDDLILNIVGAFLGLLVALRVRR